MAAPCVSDFSIVPLPALGNALQVAVFLTPVGVGCVGVGAVALAASLGWPPPAWAPGLEPGAASALVGALMLAFGAPLAVVGLGMLRAALRVRRFLGGAGAPAWRPDGLLEDVGNAVIAELGPLTSGDALSRLGLAPVRESPLLRLVGWRPTDQDLHVVIVVEGARRSANAAGDQVLLRIRLLGGGGRVPVREGFWVMGKGEGGAWQRRHAWSAADGPTGGADPLRPGRFELRA